MKKTSFITHTITIIIVIISISCNSPSIDKSVNLVQEVTTTPSLVFDSVFLSLSPLMSFEEFNQAIQRENNKNRLTNGAINIKTNKENEFTFKVKKTEKSIRLQSYTIPLSENQLKRNYHKTLFKDFINIYKNKYIIIKEPPFIGFNNFDEFTETFEHKKDSYGRIKSDVLPKNGFKNPNIIVFRDNIKTILIGFSIHPPAFDILWNELDKMTPKSTENKKVISNGGWVEEVDILPTPEEYKQKKYKDNEEGKYEFEITIDYFLNSEYDFVRDEIKKQVTIIRNNQKIDKEKIEQKRVNTINEL